MRLLFALFTLTVTMYHEHLIDSKIYRQNMTLTWIETACTKPSSGICEVLITNEQTYKQARFFSNKGEAIKFDFAAIGEAVGNTSTRGFTAQPSFGSTVDLWWNE